MYMKRILCLMGSDQMYALTAASVSLPAGVCIRRSKIRICNISKRGRFSRPLFVLL